MRPNVKIGCLEIESTAALAPMAGVADLAMRTLCHGYGAAFSVSPLVSAKAMSLGDKKSFELLKITDDMRPAGAQLFGGDPAIMAVAARLVSKMPDNVRPDFIDINMGCPAPKVASSGGGVILMRDPLQCAAITKAVVSATDLPVTVKIRAGLDNDSKNAVEVAKRVEAAGAAAITVHGRTRAQMYAPPVDLEIIADVKQGVSVPVIGNGDIVTAGDAATMLEKTGCDMVMVGRGACGAPWVFAEISAWLKFECVLPTPPISERMRVMLNQIKLMCEDKGERLALLEARKHSAWYMRGVKGAAGFRRECGTIESISDLERLAYRVCIASEKE